MRPLEGADDIGYTVDEQDKSGQGEQRGGTPVVARYRLGQGRHVHNRFIVGCGVTMQHDSHSNGTWLASSSLPDAVATLGELADDLRRRGIRRIHVLAWRDLDDPDAGGSEIHADEFMRRWAEVGLEVTHRTSRAAGLPSVSTRNGYTVIRRGGRYGVFARTAGSELVRRMGKFDALIEIWNGVPWMSPVWCHKPRVVVLHHVHGPMWDETFSRVPAAIGRTLEARVAPLFYRRTNMVALSEGTRQEIRELGIAERRIACVLPGVDPFFSAGGEKSATPMVLSVARLAPGKRMPALLEAMAKVRAAVPAVQLVIVGEGPERIPMAEWIRANDAADWVSLRGRVDNETLRDLYRQAWLVSSASVAEGWGMTLTEAGACATPAVVTDVNGHRNAVIDGETGLLASLEHLPAAIERVLLDDELRLKLGSAAQTYAQSLTWDRTATELLRVVHDEVIGHRTQRRRR